MYDSFRWTAASARRNRLTMEYEPLQPFFLVALAEKIGCGTFLDVGANIGVYSLFGTSVETVDRVIAFEADPATVRELKANVALNSLGSKIEVQNKAVSSAPGKLNFGVVDGLSGANSVVSTSIHRRSTFKNELTVDAIALDQLFATSFPRPLCIKIDVEGHEGAVIDGAMSVLNSNEAVIQVEEYAGAGTSTRRKLEQLGYRRLTEIGPDRYFSNIELFRDPAEVLDVYEFAARQMIEQNHRKEPVTLRCGGVTIQLTGRSAWAARKLKRTLSRRLRGSTAG